MFHNDFPGAAALYKRRWSGPEAAAAAAGRCGLANTLVHIPIACAVVLKTVLGVFMSSNVIVKERLRRHLSLGGFWLCLWLSAASDVEQGSVWHV
jgi:hypothetical protein